MFILKKYVENRYLICNKNHMYGNRHIYISYIYHVYIYIHIYILILFVCPYGCEHKDIKFESGPDKNVNFGTQRMNFGAPICNFETHPCL